MILSDGIEEATVEEATVTMINMTKAQHLQKILLCFIWCTPSQFVDFLSIHYPSLALPQQPSLIHYRKDSVEAARKFLLIYYIFRFLRA